MWCFCCCWVRRNKYYLRRGRKRGNLSGRDREDYTYFWRNECVYNNNSWWFFSLSLPLSFSHYNENELIEGNRMCVIFLNNNIYLMRIGYIYSEFWTFLWNQGKTSFFDWFLLRLIHWRLRTFSLKMPNADQPRVKQTLNCLLLRFTSFLRWIGQMKVCFTKMKNSLLRKNSRVFWVQFGIIKR